MIITKKGSLVLEVIIAVVITLLALVPACSLAAELTRTSDQAKKSFLELAEGINDYANSQESKPQQFFLILDAGTFIAFFRGNEEIILSKKMAEKIVTSSGGVDDKFKPKEPEVEIQTYYTPPSTCEQFPCFCLCRDAQKSEQNENVVVGDNVFERYRYTCNSAPTCKTFLGLHAGESWGVIREAKEDLRRHIVTLEKVGGQVQFKVE